MTDEQKLEILEERERYAFGVLQSLEPTTNEFLCCMESIRQIQHLAFKMKLDKDSAGRIKTEPEPDSDPAADVAPRGTWEAGGNEAVEAEEPAAEPVESSAEAKSEDAAPSDEPSAANEEPSKPYTKEEVTAILTDLRNNHGVDIAAVMQELGFAKLSSVPAERYAELIRKAQAAKESA